MISPLALSPVVFFPVVGFVCSFDLVKITVWAGNILAEESIELVCKSAVTLTVSEISCPAMEILRVVFDNFLTA